MRKRSHSSSPRASRVNCSLRSERSFQTLFPGGKHLFTSTLWINTLPGVTTTTNRGKTPAIPQRWRFPNCQWLRRHRHASVAKPRRDRHVLHVQAATPPTRVHVPALAGYPQPLLIGHLGLSERGPLAERIRASCDAGGVAQRESPSDGLLREF